MEKKSIGNHSFIIDHFLTEEECTRLILRSEAIGFEEAKVQLDGNQVMMKGIRNNQRILLTDVELAEAMWFKLQPFMPSEIGRSEAIGLNELFRFYKYEPGERFKKHRDGSYIRNESEASYFTFLIYLNADFEGGTTKLEEGIVEPETGRALVFPHSLKHSGEQVIKGTKYVLRSDVMYRLINS